MSMACFGVHGSLFACAATPELRPCVWATLTTWRVCGVCYCCLHLHLVCGNHCMTSAQHSTTLPVVLLGVLFCIMDAVSKSCSNAGATAVCSLYCIMQSTPFGGLAVGWLPATHNTSSVVCVTYYRVSCWLVIMVGFVCRTEEAVRYHFLQSHRVQKLCMLSGFCWFLSCGVLGRAVCSSSSHPTTVLIGCFCTRSALRCSDTVGWKY